jgi:hypothetical protein
MKSTGVLKEEHGGVKIMLGILGKVCDRLGSGQTVPAGDLDRLSGFSALRRYARRGVVFQEGERADGFFIVVWGSRWRMTSRGARTGFSERSFWKTT